MGHAVAGWPLQGRWRLSSAAAQGGASSPREGGPRPMISPLRRDLSDRRSILTSESKWVWKARVEGASRGQHSLPSAHSVGRPSVCRAPIPLHSIFNQLRCIAHFGGCIPRARPTTSANEVMFANIRATWSKRGSFSHCTTLSLVAPSWPSCSTPSRWVSVAL